ncbi:hypothetical protein AABB24_031839 [Solanum stoloniferum]|uniref:Reverse transcriptase zinc-binding domain-containing protein n=1 Tax=Solanum stoloniferum TaxID=62892 RepID=A0ABD2RWQ6_9SOLN
MPVAWEKICTPKKCGGLNIRSCKSWNIASVGKLLWQLATKQDLLWVKWVHGIYIKDGAQIWNHRPSADSSCYWRKLNSLKEQMIHWYSRGTYQLSPSGNYSVSKSYITLLGQLPRVKEAELIWNSMMLPKHRMILWIASQNRILTKERMNRLNIPVDDLTCCLCEEDEIEIQAHLFARCGWISEIKIALSTWSGLYLQERGVIQIYNGSREEDGRGSERK